MTPFRDPIKNLVYSAREEDLKKVVINGRTVMDERNIPGVDIRQLSATLHASGERLWDRIPQADWGERDVDELSPVSLPRWGE